MHSVFAFLLAALGRATYKDQGLKQDASHGPHIVARDQLYTIAELVLRWRVVTCPDGARCCLAEVGEKQSSAITDENVCRFDIEMTEDRRTKPSGLLSPFGYLVYGGDSVHDSQEISPKAMVEQDGMFPDATDEPTKQICRSEFL